MHTKEAAVTLQAEREVGNSLAHTPTAWFPTLKEISMVGKKAEDKEAPHSMSDLMYYRGGCGLGLFSFYKSHLIFLPLVLHCAHEDN